MCARADTRIILITIHHIHARTHARVHTLARIHKHARIYIHTQTFTHTIQKSVFQTYLLQNNIYFIYSAQIEQITLDLSIRKRTNDQILTDAMLDRDNFTSENFVNNSRSALSTILSLLSTRSSQRLSAVLHRNEQSNAERELVI